MSCQEIPIIGTLPMAVLSTAIGVGEGIKGVLQTPFSERGPRSVLFGFNMMGLVVAEICLSLIKLNPYHALPKQVSEITHTRAVQDVFDARIKGTESPLMKRIYVLTALTPILIARVADLALGAFSLLAALITAGRFEAINTQACSHLMEGFQITGDLPVCLARLVRPDATSYHM